jgi:ABC-2 type transport system permease protein
MRRTLRVMFIGCVSQITSLSTIPFFVFVMAVQPLALAFIAVYMFKVGGHKDLGNYAILGVGMMGIWSITLFASAQLIAWERFMGTLELLMAAPMPFQAVMLGTTLGNSALGLVSVGFTLLCGAIVFEIPVTLASPLLFVLTLILTIGACATLGLLLAVSFFLAPTTTLLRYLLQYLVWIVGGLVFPISLLPNWIRPLSYVLATTWGMRAMRAAALGGDTQSILFDLGMVAALGVLYYLLASAAFRLVDTNIRRRGTISIS